MVITILVFVLWGFIYFIFFWLKKPCWGCYWWCSKAIAAIHVLTTELALTNRRIIAKSGLIRRNTIELKTNRVESLGVHQGILGRIFNFGSIVVKGVGGSHAPIPYIARPMDFRQQVNNYLDELDDQKSA